MTDDDKRRYLNDPVFHAAVEMMRSFLQTAHLAPSEVREAAMMACIIEEERKPTRIQHVCEKAGMPVVVSPCLACELESRTNIVRTLGEEGRIIP